MIETLIKVIGGMNAKEIRMTMQACVDAAKEYGGDFIIVDNNAAAKPALKYWMKLVDGFDYNMTPNGWAVVGKILYRSSLPKLTNGQHVLIALKGGGGYWLCKTVPLEEMLELELDMMGRGSVFFDALELLDSGTDLHELMLENGVPQKKGGKKK